MAMGKIYAKAVIKGPEKGGRTLESVPDMWKAGTIAALRELCTEEQLAEILGESAA